MTKNYTLRITLFCLVLSISVAFFNKANAQYLPKPDHIIILIEENQPQGNVIGNSAAPYINALATDSDAALLTKFYAIEHPSQPNYLDMFSGNNQGVLDDNLPANYPFITPNLAYELLNKGYSYISYSQDLPSVGSDIENSSVGSYARKHNPVTNWVGTGPNQVPDTCSQPFQGYFPTDYSKLPTVCYVVPNEDSDMHNGSYPTTVTAGDFYMHEHLDSLLKWVKNNNALFVYMFDEDDGFAGNNTPMLLYGPMVKGGSYSTHWDFYSLLRTIEDMYSLGQHAGAAASATDITGVWRIPTGINNVEANTPSLQVYPNPASGAVTFDGTKLSDASGEISITDLTGRVVSISEMPASKKLIINTSAYNPGLYFYHFQHGGNAETGKIVISR